MTAPPDRVPDSDLLTRVRSAVASVADPEYPGVSIADLGMVESIAVAGRDAVVDLIPTYSGCPALDMIASDVAAAVGALDGIDACTVRWLPAPVWDPTRVTIAGEQVLGREYTVVLRSADGGIRCPVCGSRDVTGRSLAGATRCRAVAWCSECRNPVEVLR